MNGRIIIDTSSIAWTALLAGSDPEARKVKYEDKEVKVNTADFGYEKAVSFVIDQMEQLQMVPTQLIFVVEGKLSKTRRAAFFRDYKAGRDTRPPEAYEEFNRLVSDLTNVFRSVGSAVVSQDGVEGDDVIAYLVQNLTGDKYILSNDGDLSALLSEDVFQIRQGKLITENPYGNFPTKYISVYKALVGDSSDNLKGANGFGPKAFEQMLEVFGHQALPAIESMIRQNKLDELGDDVAEFKLFQKVIDSAEHVRQCFNCALLYPEWVNTLRMPLQWKPGMVRGRDVVKDERLYKYAQQVRLITKDNFEDALKFMRSKMMSTPVVSLDIETSTPVDSDLWLEARGKEDKVDVFGSFLTGLGLTFGNNGQYTFYFSVDHADTRNLTSTEVLEAVNHIPANAYTIVHNASFELPILYGEWGKLWVNNGWQGFLPNVLDTAIMSSYVDENRSQGLKKLSSELLDYEQQTYDEVTTVDGVQLKMNELTAEHVLSYGADDTICTLALYHHFNMVMEIERTWDVMLQVEQKTSYVKALAFHNGVRFSLESMLDQEREDREEFEKNWLVVRDFLIERGWEGTQCPRFEKLDAAAVKTAVNILLGVEFKTQVRTPSKMAKLMLDEGSFPDIANHPDAQTLAGLIEKEDVETINKWMAEMFSGEPIFDVNSPKQMSSFLYDELKLPVRIVNKVTANERATNKDLAAAMQRYRKIWSGSDSEPALTEREQDLIRLKAKADDTAVDFALAFDVERGSQVEKVLKAFQRMKTCMTRQNLFYNNYKNIRHWRDNKVHGQAGQCRTVTRRDAPSDPNLAQLPKRGEGVKFRRNFLAHHKDAVVVTIDFAQQELRQGAGQSMDENMLSCFVGENKRDMHAMTAAGAMRSKWGKDTVKKFYEVYGQEGDTDYTLFVRLRALEDEKEIAKQADDLRKVAKNVNFGAQYDATAPTLAETIIIMPKEAQTFLDAKMAMFPRFEDWKEEVKSEVRKTGYAMTCMGARRHLRDSILSDNKWDVEKAMRQGPNFNIQGSSGEQVRLAQSRMWDSGILFKLDMHFYFSVHDELVWSVHRDHALESIKVMHEIMTRPYGDLPVPFNGSISLGLNYGDQVELGEEVDEDKIIKALNELFDVEEVAT